MEHPLQRKKSETSKGNVESIVGKWKRLNYYLIFKEGSEAELRLIKDNKLFTSKRRKYLRIILLGISWEWDKMKLKKENI